jgi:hypothetical protein
MGMKSVNDFSAFRRRGITLVQGMTLADISIQMDEEIVNPLLYSPRDRRKDRRTSDPQLGGQTCYPKGSHERVLK